ncbi:MAG: tetratricopeptide repeat protein [Syntrophaceae bacterium]|nr:tetratricopeptide repeat protein [Syntrophaceae bacterium]
MKKGETIRLREGDGRYGKGGIGRRVETVLALSIFLLVLIVFGQTGGFDFIHFDDNVYVTGNAHVRSGLTGPSVAWAFSTLEEGFWHPLTWLSLMLDARLYGAWAGGFHWTNVLLHGLSAIILFLTLSRMTDAPWRSAFVAGLFAVHPLHVESVAWVAERKDVLCGFFWMASLAAYAWYALRPGFWRYGLLLAVFLLGLMAKPMIVTLPFVLLLLDAWPLRRDAALLGILGKREFSKASWWWLILEKIPLLAISAGFSALAYWAEFRAGALGPGDVYPIADRVANALVSYTSYLQHLFWPTGLAPFYPHPGRWPEGEVLLSGIVLAVISSAVFALARRRPWLGVGWLWYLGTLVPVSGIVQIGNIAMADRFTYIPLIGPAVMLAWGVSDLPGRSGAGRRVAVLAGMLLLAVCALLSRHQAAYWENTETLFRHTLAVTERNYKAHHALGLALHERGLSADAIRHLGLSLELREDSRARNDLGVALMGAGRFREAEAQFRRAVALRPATAKYWNNLGAAVASQDRPSEAVPLFREALRLRPDYGEARRNLEQALGVPPGASPPIRRK